MAALGCTFSCLVPQPEAVQLKGAGAKSPLFAGQTIVAHGMYDDASETGPGIFLVLRQVGSTEYVMAPLGSTDSHWESHLKSATTVKALLWKDVKDPIPNDRELLRRWQVVAAAGDEPKKLDFMAFGKATADHVVKKWRFLSELVVSDSPPPQAVTVPFYR